MLIAHVTAPGHGETNRLLAAIAEQLQQRGYRVCGTVQTDTETSRSHLCDMDVTVLPDGPVLRISQNLGPDAKGCRLNPDALETSVGLTLQNIRQGADLVIINKFGKQEADGRGFRDAIAEAIGSDIPVIVGVNATNLPALNAFCDGAAQALDPTVDAAVDWAVAAIGRQD